MYEAQVTKMQRYLERGDTEKAKVEEELARAMALTAQGDRQVSLTPQNLALPCQDCSPCLLFLFREIVRCLLDRKAAAAKA